MLRRVVLITAVVTSVTTACASPSGTQQDTHAAGSGASSPNSSTPTSTPVATHAVSTAQIRSQAAAQVAAIVKSEPPGAVSVAALNMATRADYRAGARSGMWTASAYKLLVLTALLLRNGSLTEGEEATASLAIENSDNAAGYSLFLDAGGDPGLESAVDKLGMIHTVPGSTDPTFTKTSASDYLRLLAALVTAGPLSAASRTFVLNLMRNVEADQRWGVGVVADKGTRFANKNGWLSIDNSNGAGETDDNLWVVTSVGVLTVAHQQVLMAIFTRHQPSFRTGVALVQNLARAVVRTVSPQA